MPTRDELLELVPHYVAMVLIVLFAMTIIRAVVGEQHILIEFAIILALVFAYRPFIHYFDVMPVPTLWEREEN